MIERDAAGLQGRLLAIFDSVADGVTVLDRSWTIRFANDAAAQLMGRASAAEIIGQPSAALTGHFDILDVDGGPVDIERLPTRRAFAGEERPEQVVRFRVRGASEDRWSLVRARLLSGPTTAEDLVVTAFQDITSLKRSEERLRLLAEASAVLGASVDYHETLAGVARVSVPRLADLCVVDVIEWSQKVSRVAVQHWDPEMRAVAEEVQRRWPPDPSRPGAVQQVLQARQSVHLPEVGDELLREAARDDEHLGLLRSLQMRAVLVVPLEARGEILGALTLVQSESGRSFEPDDIALAEEVGRRAGAAIDTARLMWDARETARVRDEFMAVASHDMRTPLAAVRGYAQLARRHIADSDAPDPKLLDRWLGDIEGVVGRLNQLVSELMDASLVQGGHDVPLQVAETNLATLVTELVARRGHLSDGHRFAVDLDGPAPVGLWDAARLSRVLDNLLDNAVKFSPDGGEIRVRLGLDDGLAALAVSDRGIGIAPAELDLIFNPMFRGRNARTTVGTGLGLAGSRHLVAQMGGTMAVESEVGAGATFTIRLPLGPPEGSEPPTD